MDFQEILALLQNPPEDGLPETIYDDLNASYSDRDSHASSADAKITELTQALETAASEIAVLKSHNYDLLMSVPGDEVEHAPADPDDEPEISIDDLYSDEDQN